VEHIRQELEKQQLDVRLDYGVLAPGDSFWSKIEVEMGRCDACLVVATERALQSKSCREELAWALDEALAKDGDLRLIPLLYDPRDVESLPAPLRTRQAVALGDADWAKKVAAAVRGELFQGAIQPTEPYALSWHPLSPGAPGIALEIRPRFTWDTLHVVIPNYDDDATEAPPYIALGVPGYVPTVPKRIVRGRPQQTCRGLELHIVGQMNADCSAYLVMPGGRRPVRFGPKEDVPYAAET
jgi:hypothetical protein